VLPESGSVDVPVSPSADGALSVALARALAAPPLGPDVAVTVIDVETGDDLLAQGDTRPQQPASTLKALTSIAVLRALGDDTRLTTRVVSGATAGEIVLVGAGDATLTRLPATPADLPAGQSARPASLGELATRTASTLLAAGRTSVTLRVDDTLFTGPRTAAGWPDTFVTTGVVSPVSALSADSGRVSADSRVRDADPALAAGAYFATRLTQAGVKVTGPVTRAISGRKATLVASVTSPTVAELVERMLTASDNDLAEALAHLAGGVLGGEASFAGGGKAVVRVLTELGVPTTGLVVVDGSGLSKLDHVSTRTLATALATAATDPPFVGDTVGVLWPTTSGLPVAGATGTLTERFDTPGTGPGRGVVRAKTGTLSGVVSLAGLVRDSHGRLLAFSIVADQSPGPLLDAQAALDRAASLLAVG
jgi:D-alanyl-D-alanine carboxypeptidase/D-alanyl-D-alanine-endopeptidase (penicillin-binding protein 4)